MRQLRDLRLRIFVFCLRILLAFIAFLAHFLFRLRIFSYARPCVRCVRCMRLNVNRAIDRHVDLFDAPVEDSDRQRAQVGERTSTRGPTNLPVP